MSKIIAPGGPVIGYTVTIRGMLQAPDENTAKALVLQQLSFSAVLANTIDEMAVETAVKTLQVVKGT